MGLIIPNVNCVEEAEEIVRRKIEPLIAAGCDKIVLGCTHFPHLRHLIEKVAADRAEIVEPSRAVALRAKSVLEARGLTAVSAEEAKHIFISSRKGDLR